MNDVNDQAVLIASLMKRITALERAVAESNPTFQGVTVGSGGGTSVTVNGIDGVAQLILDAGGTTGVMDARTILRDDGVNRWIYGMDESDDKRWIINRYNASGVLQDQPLTVDASTGAVLINGSQVPVIRYGAVTGVPAGGSAAVSFGHTFSSTPRVQTTTVTSANANSTAASITTTGCTVYNHDAATRSIAWLAVG